MKRPREIFQMCQRPLVTMVLLHALLVDVIFTVIINGSLAATLIPGFTATVTPSQEGWLVSTKFYICRRSGEFAWGAWTLGQDLQSLPPQDVMVFNTVAFTRQHAFSRIVQDPAVVTTWLDGGEVSHDDRDRATQVAIASLRGRADDLERLISRPSDGTVYDFDESPETFRRCARFLDEHRDSRTRIVWWGIANSVIAFGLISAAVLSASWLPAWLRSRRKQPWQCRRCGYDLRGATANTCPECGELR